MKHEESCTGCKCLPLPLPKPPDPVLARDLLALLCTIGDSVLGADGWCNFKYIAALEKVFGASRFYTVLQHAIKYGYIVRGDGAFRDYYRLTVQRVVHDAVELMRQQLEIDGAGTYTCVRTGDDGEAIRYERVLDKEPTK